MRLMFAGTENESWGFDNFMAMQQLHLDHVTSTCDADGVDYMWTGGVLTQPDAREAVLSRLRIAEPKSSN